MWRVQVADWLIKNGFRILLATCDPADSRAVDHINMQAKKIGEHRSPEKYGGIRQVLLYYLKRVLDSVQIVKEALNFGK